MGMGMGGGGAEGGERAVREGVWLALFRTLTPGDCGGPLWAVGARYALLESAPPGGVHPTPSQQGWFPPLWWLAGRGS